MLLSRMIRLGLGFALAALVTLAPAAAHQEEGSIRLGQPTRRFAVDLPLGGAGSVLAVGSWTRNDVQTGERGFARIDPRRSQAQAVMPLPSGPLAVALGEGSLWVARVGGSQVEQVDARTGKIVGRFRAGDVVALVVGQGRIWTAARDGTVREISRE